MRLAAKAARTPAGVVLFLLFLSVPWVPPALAATDGIRVAATIDDAPVGRSTESRPIRLSPRGQATLSVEVTNDSAAPLDVRIVRLEGKVVGLTFFAYDTAVGLRVPPGQSGSRRFLLDLGGLNGQATGLIPGAVKLLDADRKVVAEQAGVVDVRGSLRSVYGFFGLGVAFLTGMSFLGALVGLARHRLPANRWRRALRFLTPGLGLGLLLNFTLSATRVFVPTPGRWLTIVVVSAALLFGLGYLTPAPDSGDDDEDDEEEMAALHAPRVEPELPAAPSRPALSNPEAMEALPAEPAAKELELPDRVAGEQPAPVPALAAEPARTELATPDGSEALPGLGATRSLADPTESVDRPAPPTVVVPTVPPAEP